jgi:hypothetical protein
MSFLPETSAVIPKLDNALIKIALFAFLQSKGNSSPYVGVKKEKHVFPFIYFF